MKRPVGVMVVAVVQVLLGLLILTYALVGVGGLWEAIQGHDWSALLSWLALFAFGLAEVGAAIGLWLLHPAGWNVSLTLWVVIVVAGLFSALGNIGRPAMYGGLAVLLFGIAAIIFLFLRRTYRHFFTLGRGDSPPRRLVIHWLLIIVCAATVYPALRVVSVALRPGDRLLSTSLELIPPDATLANFGTVLFDKAFFSWIWNSIIITMTTAVFGVVLAATSAYAFSRWKFPGRGPGLVFLLATQMIPAAMLTLPIYILAVRLGLVGSYRGLVLAYSVGSIPFSIWILKGYYDTIPVDLEEAAMIDGASRMSSFYRIVLPLSSPALAIVFLFNFMTAWNDFLLARVMLPRPELSTWTLGLQAMQGQFQTQWGAFCAASILVSIPVMALFLYSSRWLISGLTLGSVKG